MEERAALITFGLGGHSVYYFPTVSPGCTSSCTVSGYDNPEQFSVKLSAGEYNVPDGTPVVDGRAAFGSPGGVSLAMGAPLVDPGLSEPSRFRDFGKDSIVVSAFREGNAT